MVGRVLIIAGHVLALSSMANYAQGADDTQDLGTYGEVFAIKEKSLIEVIKGKLQALQDSGELTSHQEEVKKRVLGVVRRPRSVMGVINTIKPRTFTYDPTITVNRDIIGHKGNIIQKKGTKVNPLKMRGLSKPFIFFDGDDDLQVKWARGIRDQYPNVKLILIKGSPLDKDLRSAVSDQQGRPAQLYFDQGGTLTKKLGISQVPAIVKQEGDLLLIKEVRPS